MNILNENIQGSKFDTYSRAAVYNTLNGPTSSDPSPHSLLPQIRGHGDMDGSHRFRMTIEA
jgi:hypothetical protein